MWSIENSGAVGTTRRADALRPPISKNPFAHFGFDERFTTSVFAEQFPSLWLRLAANSAKLNRQTPEVERFATHRKQTTVLCSNSQKFKFCKTENLSLTALRVVVHGSRLPLATSHSSLATAFLTGSGSQTEIAVTYSKQRTAQILTGSRIALKRLSNQSKLSPEFVRGAPDAAHGSRLWVHGSRLPLATSLSLALTKEGPLATASQQVYASSAVCYAYCMSPQFPSDKQAQAVPESAPVRAQSSQSTASAHVGNADSITSRDNKWLKQFRAALRGAGPAEGEPIAAEGPKLVEEGVRSGLETEALLVSETGERHLERILFAASESDSGVPRSRIFRTSDKLFESVAGTEAPQGVAALFRRREWSFDDVMRGRANFDGAYRSDSPLIVVMAAVQDPGNVGTIVRSAEAFGASGVVGTRGAADPWSPKALRASAGSALRLPLLRGVAIPILLAQLRVAGVKILAAGSRPHVTAAARDAGTPITDLRGPCAIFIGNEGAGLPSEVEHAADDWVSIAMNDEVESLNAGVAGSVILFEAARQRRGA
jgi:RNA methyltransferase, TrmH family